MLVGNFRSRWLLLPLLLLPAAEGVVAQSTRVESDQWLVFGAQDEVRSAVLKDQLDLLEKRYLRRIGEQP